MNARPLLDSRVDSLRRVARIASGVGGWELFLIALLTGTVTVATASSPYFLTGLNFQLGAGNFMEVSIMAMGMTLIIVAREIDLSVASTMGLCSVVLGLLSAAGISLPVVLVVVLATGILAGSLNAFLIVKVGLPSIVVTIGTLALFRGLSYGLFGQKAISSFPNWFTNLGIGVLAGTNIPWSVVIFVAIFLAFGVLLHKTYIGRQIYVLGLNAQAARFAGVKVNRIRFALFVASGVLAAIAAIIFTARVSSVRADNGVGLELQVIAAVLLGGVSIFGGRGSLLGVLLSLSLIAVLRDAFTLHDVGTGVQDIVIGALMILAVLLPELVGRLRRRLVLLRERRSNLSQQPI
ncbi:MAG: ABC transporter permease [Pseudarthrobacter sp.]